MLDPLALMHRRIAQTLAAMSIHDQIRSRRIAKGWSQEKLAETVSKQLGLTKSLSWQTVQQWENGKSAPKRERLEAVATVLGTSVNELLEVAENPNVQSVKARRSVPIISWVRAGAMGDVSDPFQPGEAEDWTDVYDTMPGEQAFALRVQGDSMTSPFGSEGFPDGTILIVDPSRAAQAGDYVIAKDVNTQQATFKKLTYDGGRWYLRPLNPSYPTIEIDDPAVRVIGKVIESQHRRKL
jgi:SOS-response transcriptional repressor LexA